MQVRLLTSMAGPNMSAQYGDIVDFPDATAKRLIEQGLAEPVALIVEDIESQEASGQKSSGEETAVQPEVETASTRPAATRGRRRKEV